MSQINAFPRMGYYSLVQYSPDAMRQEAATLGLLLFCPEWNWLRIRTTSSLVRLTKFFKNDDFEADQVRAALSALEERVQVINGTIKGIEEFQEFIALRANSVKLTDPRPTRVRDLDEDFERLYARAVPRIRHTKRAPIIPELDRMFREAVRQGKAEEKVRVSLGLGEKMFEAPFAYQNGKFNLIKPIEFSEEEPTAVKQVERLSFECRQVARQMRSDGGAQQVVIVARPPQSLPWRIIKTILEDYDARVEEADHLERIRQELLSAH